MLDSLSDGCVVERGQDGQRTATSDAVWDNDETVNVTAYAYLQTEAPGRLGIIKHDGSSDKVVAGAVYGVYEDSACTKEITSITTGNSHVYVTLAPGTYYVKEKSAPTGYVKNTAVYSASISSNGTANLTAYDDPWSGSVKVTVSSTALTSNGTTVTVNVKDVPTYDVTTEVSMVPSVTQCITSTQEGKEQSVTSQMMVTL